ncbi:hypothetical protein KP509_09G002100 [Ceratopteris richardii]|uniref:Uncharacterized protein n=1 Tax=Ceratopteris richardii TaxID=49495 RepID=A0A8T2U477_CERRI|nr:hypothetical protein KP509_09G002100 [Ceratopteris richardii]
MDISSLALRSTRAAMGLSVLSTALPSASSTSLSVPSFSVINSDLLHRSIMSVSTCTSGALPMPRLLSQKPLHFQAPPSSKLRCYGSNVAEDAKRKFAKTASDVEKSSKEMGGKAREHAEGMADEAKRRTEAVTAKLRRKESRQSLALENCRKVCSERPRRRKNLLKRTRSMEKKKRRALRSLQKRKLEI